MNWLAISTVLFVTIFVVSSITTATAQHNTFYPSYSTNSAKRQNYPTNRQNYFPPNRGIQRPTPTYRPDLPLEQQLHYDRNAVGHTVG